MNLKLLPLFHTFFSVQQEIKNKQSGSRVWPRAVTDCALRHFHYGSGEDSTILLEIGGSSVVLPFSEPQQRQTGMTPKCTCLAWSSGWHGEAAIKPSLKYLLRVMKGIKPRNVLFTAHVLSSLFMGNSFQLCPSVGCSGSEVMPLKQPELLQIYAAARGGRICLTAFDVSCASQAALCLRLWVSPDSLIFTSCPCKATCKCVYWSSTIISYSSGWLTCQKRMSFFRPLFLQVLVV